MAEEIKAKKVPYVCLSADVERDEYNNLSLTEWNVDSTDTLYIVGVIVTGKHKVLF